MYKTLLIIALFGVNPVVQAQNQPAFTVVPLGVKGGLDESNLSAYMVAAAGSNDYICLDAGTLYSGIRKAVENGVFTTSVSAVLRSSIKGYFISHPHLDHVAGLIINSPEDSSKNIFGLPACLNVLRDKYFTWESWANFGDDGEKPQLKKYHYVPMRPAEEMAIEHTPLAVKAWPLSHGPNFESTAFFVRSKDDYLLYLGDTGADSIEQSSRLHTLWLVAGPLIKTGRLKAIFIEVSFPNEQPDKLLFGHLTPRLFLHELNSLANIIGVSSLKGLNVVITHRKPGATDPEATIRRQLEENPLGVNLIFPEQGKKLTF